MQSDRILCSNWVCTAGEKIHSIIKTPSDENVKINENEYCIWVHISSFTTIEMGETLRETQL